MGQRLAVMTKMFPEPTDPRHRATRAEVRALKGRGKRLYEEALDRLGSVAR
jgi:hypothetical protein